MFPIQFKPPRQLKDKHWNEYFECCHRYNQACAAFHIDVPLRDTNIPTPPVDILPKVNLDVWHHQAHLQSGLLLAAAKRHWKIGDDYAAGFIGAFVDGDLGKMGLGVGFGMDMDHKDTSLMNINVNPHSQPTLTRTGGGGGGQRQKQQPPLGVIKEEPIELDLWDHGGFHDMMHDMGMMGTASNLLASQLSMLRACMRVLSLVLRP